MKREDATIIIRAISIGLFSVLVLMLSGMLVAFMWCAKRTEMEIPW